MNIEQLLKIIQDAAYEVRKSLCAGYLESVYQNALVYELRLRGLKAESAAPINVTYKGFLVGVFRADILVEGSVIIELKAVKELSSVHEMQLVNYLKATGIEYGFLINYGGDVFAIHKKTKSFFNPNQ